SLAAAHQSLTSRSIPRGNARRPRSINAERLMLKVGLTGGIGCGKSTVAAMMRELGCRVIDADAISRDLAEPGQPAYLEIVAAFGQEILLADGKLDRARIAHLVFANASKLSKLNKILHPRVI